MRQKKIEHLGQFKSSPNPDIVARLEQSFEKPMSSEHEVNDLRELLQQINFYFI